MALNVFNIPEGERFKIKLQDGTTAEAIRKGHTIIQLTAPKVGPMYSVREIESFSVHNNHWITCVWKQEEKKYDLESVISDSINLEDVWRDTSIVMLTRGANPYLTDEGLKEFQRKESCPIGFKISCEWLKESKRLVGNSDFYRFLRIIFNDKMLFRPAKAVLISPNEGRSGLFIVLESLSLSPDNDITNSYLVQYSDVEGIDEEHGETSRLLAGVVNCIFTKQEAIIGNRTRKSMRNAVSEWLVDFLLSNPDVFYKTIAFERSYGLLAPIHQVIVDHLNLRYLFDYAKDQKFVDYLNNLIKQDAER